MTITTAIIDRTIFHLFFLAYKSIFMFPIFISEYYHTNLLKKRLYHNRIVYILQKNYFKLFLKKIVTLQKINVNKN